MGRVQLLAEVFFFGGDIVHCEFLCIEDLHIIQPALI